MPVPDDELEEAVASGDMRRSLEAIREYLAHELGGHRCDKCQMSQLRTGDTAALVLRLTTVIKEIAALPDMTGAVSKLDELRARRDGRTNTPNPTPASVAKNSQRRQGGRRPG